MEAGFNHEKKRHDDGRKNIPGRESSELNESSCVPGPTDFLICLDCHSLAKEERERPDGEEFCLLIMNNFSFFYLNSGKTLKD